MYNIKAKKCNKMKANAIKIYGALSELNTSRSNVKHFDEESLSCEIESNKDEVISRLDELFDRLENLLKRVITDKTIVRQKEDV